MLLNEMAALPGGLDLVLDDYHLIDSEPVHGIVSFMLERLPESVHLVVSCRVQPPLPLARLRARGQMTELNAAELSFTREEAAAFLKEVMGLDLSAEDVAKLEERTEGWVAGLQLAALSMRDREDVSGFVESFSGSHRDVLDFLAEEVLERQPTHVREFLLKTSILDGLSGPLCDALTGRSDGDEMLKRLERENLFVVALDDERRWYRYHHLFADFLRGRLRRESPEGVRELHLGAAEWSEREGRISSAIEHALSAPDHDLAARLIEEGVEGAVERGEGTTALRWLEALPIWAKRRHPRLLPAHAVVLTVTGRPDDVEPLLEEAERLAEVAGEDHPFLLGYAAAVRSWRARLRGDAPEAVELARRALSLLPAEALAQRNFAAGSLGDALRTTGDLEAAEEALAEAIEIGLVGDHAYGTLAAMVWRARVQMEQGRLREAENSFRRALLFVTERGVGLLPAAGLAHLGMGALLYERDELDRAERELEEGVGLVQRAREVSNLVWGYVTLSRTRRARGDEEGALTTADDAERVARDAGADLAISIAVSWKERLREWDVGAVASDREHAAPSVGALTSARLLYARGRHREALRMLEEQLEAAEKAGRGGEIIEILALRSSGSWARNEKGRAVADLARALSLAEPEGYVRTFVDEGSSMAEMLSGMLEASRRGSLDLPVPAHYPRKLLAALERGSARAATSAGGLPEGLTGRELEILSLVGAGMSNGRIASELFVSVGTVKTHLNNVNRKLDARSRTQAVARARDLKLI